MKSRCVSLRKNPAGSPENEKISYPGKGTRFGKHLGPVVQIKISNVNISHMPIFFYEKM